MSSAEFADWMHYWTLEPFGIEAWQMGELLSMFYNVHRKKGAKTTKPEDHIPGFKRVVKSVKRVVQSIHQLVTAMTRKVDGNDNRKSGDASVG